MPKVFELNYDENFVSEKELMGNGRKGTVIFFKIHFKGFIAILKQKHILLLHFLLLF